jgi:hypothetical protein
MQKSFVIELRITNLIRKTPPEIENAEYHLDVIDFLENRLENIIGGMLCMDHFILPEIHPLKDFGDTWILQISCCCKKQYYFVENRIKGILK